MYPMNSFKHLRIFLTLIVMMLCASTPVTASDNSEQAIRDVWPDEFEDIAVQIAKRESRLTPHVRGCSGSCIGLFQILFPVHRHWLATIGVTQSSQLLDPVVNAKAAYHLFSITGKNWSPWCHPSGFPVSCR